MTDNCYRLSPLQHSGKHRGQRLLAALLPQNVPLDDRRIEDLILFADRYAELLNYYNNHNKISGDWKAFITTDISTIIARIVKTDHTEISTAYDKYLDHFITAPSPCSIKALFDISFSLLWEIEKMNDPSVFSTPIKIDLDKEIQGRLRIDFKNLFAYYKGANPGTPGALVEAGDGCDIDTGESPFHTVTTVISKQFSPIWMTGLTASNWPEYLNAIPADNSIYGDITWPDSNRLNYALSYIKAIFNRSFEAYVRIIKGAAVHLQYSLEKYPAHQPHNSLLLAFFKIFSHAQDSLNELSERHLQFYYHDALQLKEKPAHPDSAHLLVELAKHKKQHLIKSGTEIKAGKDADGQPLVYKVNEELTVNRASVSSIKSLFIDTHATNGGIYDAPIANSGNGLGGDFTTEKNYWRAFGQSQHGFTTQQRTMQESEVGFAIASPLLRLKEGTRKITFSFYLDNSAEELASLTSNNFVNQIQIELSGNKEWITCPALSSTLSTQANYLLLDTDNTPPNKAKLEIKVTLNGETPAITDFNTSALTGGFKSEWPIAKFVIKKNSNQNIYPLLRRLKINKVVVSTDVENIRTLVLHNDLGALDPSQPFQPFGPQPKKSSSFYLGDQEIFSKALNTLTLNIEWLGLPTSSMATHYSYVATNNSSTQYLGISNNNAFKVKAELLKNSRWQQTVGNSHWDLFATGTGSVNSINALTFTQAQLDLDAQPTITPFNAYSVSTKAGFMKLKLDMPNKAFGHELYATAMAQQAIAMSKNEAATNPTLPNPPYTPTIQSLSCDYTANVTIKFNTHYNANNGQFFHIHPFGYKELESSGTTVKLVDPFNVQRDASSQPIQGSLYIGIKGAEAQQQVSLLFKIADGTDDASLDPGNLTLEYLSHNRWIALGKHLVLDSSNGLIRSGILRFTVPDDASLDHSLMPAKQHWLRLSITENYQAFPQLLDIKAQAMHVTFFDQDNSPQHLANPLAAETMSKLVINDSAIKSIQQPYVSFGGRKQEAPENFYTRVSERLRHKQRAITIWDYEHLVLEAFPNTYKVKCLSHTNGITTAEPGTERMPGAVRIIIIPDMRKQKAGNLFAPMVSNQDREEILKYLREISNPFIDLRIENPRYEAVRVNCQVQFKENLDKNLYQGLLMSAIDRFLAPWAFDNKNELDFRGSLHQSVIINFIENLDYIDFITDFSLDLFIDNTLDKNGVSEITASTSRSILTSYRHHIIGLHTCIAVTS